MRRLVLGTRLLRGQWGFACGRPERPRRGVGGGSGEEREAWGWSWGRACFVDRWGFACSRPERPRRGVGGGSGERREGGSWCWGRACLVDGGALPVVARSVPCGSWWRFGEKARGVGVGVGTRLLSGQWGFA